MRKALSNNSLRGQFGYRKLLYVKADFDLSPISTDYKPDRHHQLCAGTSTQ